MDVSARNGGDRVGRRPKNGTPGDFGYGSAAVRLASVRDSVRHDGQEMGAIRRVGLGGGWRDGAAGETDRRRWTGERSVEALRYWRRIENIPNGWRARETYSIVNDNKFIERFELARPERSSRQDVIRPYR